MLKNFKLDNKMTAIICVSIASLLIGGSLFGVQLNKQSSIERQQRAEIEQENKIREFERLEKLGRQNQLTLCLADAERLYWKYIELNGTLVDEEAGTYSAAQYEWDEAQARKDKAEETCFKKYK